MTALPVDAQGALEVLARALTERFGRSVQAYVFGSYARHEATEGSDLDVLLIAPLELRRAVRQRAAEIVSSLQIGGAPPSASCSSTRSGGSSLPLSSVRSGGTL